MKEKTRKTRSNRYSHITYEKRLKLIELVDVDQNSTKQAAKKLRINPETAKVILRKYRKFGHIFQRKSEIVNVQPNKQENIGERIENIPNSNNQQMISFPISWQILYFVPFPVLTQNLT